MTKKTRRSDCWFAFDLADRPKQNFAILESRDLPARCSIQRNKKCPFYDAKTGKIDGSRCEFCRK